MLRISSDRRFEETKNEHLEEFARIYNSEMKVRPKEKQQVIGINKYKYEKSPISNLHSVGSNIINSVKVQKNINLQKEYDRFGNNGKGNGKYEKPLLIKGNSPKKQLRKQNFVDSPITFKLKNKFGVENQENNNMENQFSARPIEQSKLVKEGLLLGGNINMNSSESNSFLNN
jgi:hypothetical protein